MPRQTLTPLVALGEFGSYVANAADVTMTAADAANKEQFVATPRQIVFAHNTGAGARTVTITSVADEKGRSGDIATYSIGAGEYAVFGPFTSAQGFRQTDGYIYLEAAHAEVKFGVVTLS